ncbi:Mth938-like domain-containing protein [Hydrogenophaga soli]
MKLHADAAVASSIQSYGEGWVQVNGQRYTHSVVVSSTQGVRPWPCQRFEDLSAELFASLLADQPEVIVFGCGERMRFPPPATLQALMQARVGLETMGTGAACRTYNILAQEGRQVVAALLISGDGPLPVQ